MANTLITQVFSDSPKQTIIKVTILGDGSGEETKTVIFDASAYTPAVTSNTLRAIEYSLNGFGGQLLWDASTTIDAKTFSGTGLDDLTTGGTYTGTSNKSYIVEIDGTGTPDTYKWSDDGGATYTSTVNIVGGAVTLSDGVQITFAATTGHTLGDIWTFNATTDVPLITLAPDHQAYEDFYEITGLGGLYNNASTGKTGDILLTTLGLGAGDTGHILLRVRKDTSGS